MKNKKTAKESPKQPKPLPPGLIPIDSTHFKKIPIIGHIGCTK